MDEKKNALGFFDKKENYTNLFFIGGLVFLVIKFLPNIILILQNSLYAAFLFIALAAIIFILLDSKFRTLIFFLYNYAIKKFTNVFVAIDPIEIAKIYLGDLRKQQSNLLENLSSLKAQKGKLQSTIENNKKEIEHNLSIARQAEKTDKKKQFILATRKAGRRTSSNDEYEKLFNKLDLSYKVISKIAENTEISIEDLADQINQKEIEYTAIKNGHSALKSAMNILNGSGDKRLMFDQSMEYINNDIGIKLGEMQYFMDMSSKLMDSIDLENGVFLEKGLALLDKIELEGNKLLLDNSELTSETASASFDKYFKG